MNNTRRGAACTVFEEKIVVSGGYGHDNNIKQKSVESYDVTGDEWSPMPDMVNGKVSYHDMVVVKNKLFVISSVADDCELFDNTCKKFVTLKSPHMSVVFLEAIPIGSKIYVFQSDSCNKSFSIGNLIFKNPFQDEAPSMFCYDVDKDEWSEMPCDATKNLEHFSCVKVPWY